MLVYAGIDEAGLGPMLGPLVIAATVFVVEEEPAGGNNDPCDLWKLLHRSVCRETTDPRRRLPVNDSKQVYKSGSGMKHLERTVLSFLGQVCPAIDDVQALLAALAADDESSHCKLPWYVCTGEEPLPCAMDRGQVRIGAAQLKRDMQAAGVSLRKMTAAVVYEDRFNRMVGMTRSKGRAAWTFVAQHLVDIYRKYGTQNPTVIVDRQGGRTDYRELLQMAFGDTTELTVLKQKPEVSTYDIREKATKRDTSSMRISFMVGSEEQHLPTALASMTAKYVREMLMARFNRFFTRHAPQLKPTAGYTTDARRFLKDVKELLVELRISEKQMVRVR